MKNRDQRNHLCFGLGTIGRDMFYAFEANTLLYFLSDVLTLPVWVFAVASMVLSIMRVFDAINDPITGLVIDNIRSPWGKFKPAILVGGVLSAVLSVLLFAGIGEGWVFIVVFGLVYLLWDIFYGVNDIGYWTLLPVMSSDQKQREKTGAFARICANIGMYIVMVAWKPVTSALGDTPKAWFWCAVVIAVVYLLGLLFPYETVKGVQGVEQEMRVDLSFQFLVAVLRCVFLLFLPLHPSLGGDGVVDHEHYAVYGDVSDQRNDI